MKRKWGQIVCFGLAPVFIALAVSDPAHTRIHVVILFVLLWLGLMIRVLAD